MKESRPLLFSLAAWTWLLLLLLLLAGVLSCAPLPQASPAAEPTRPQAASPVPPTATASVAPEATASESATAAVATSEPVTTELQALLAAGLAPTPTPEPGGTPLWGPLEIGILPLRTLPGQPPLWAAYSVGMGYYDPVQNHFVAVYGYEEGEWREHARRVFTNCAEYVGQGSLTQVDVEPSRLWLELQAGTGAHSGCYDLLSFGDGQLRLEVSNFNSSPGAGSVADLDGDGLLEVVLDHSENYVFCYACGVRLALFQVLRWDGTGLAEVVLTRLGEDVGAQLRDLNNRAVELAEAGLWKDARQLAAEMLAQEIANESARATVTWNAALIELHAAARAEHVGWGAYPILDNAFYGDYEAAVEPMRAYDPAEIWSLESPLLVGTPAESWELALADWLSWTTGLALQAAPDLAPAHFLRGWSAFLRNPADPQALSDVQQAEALQPGDELYADSAAYLRAVLPMAVDAWQPLEPGACYDLGQAMMGTLNMTVTLATEPFQDYIGQSAGSGCQALATGTGRDFDSFWTAAEALRAPLEERGWVEDMGYAADGPTGTARAYRQNGALCLVSAGWVPAAEADCPADRPIFECELTPEQQLYTITLNCGQRSKP